jgi:hypothetical protein
MAESVAAARRALAQIGTAAFGTAREFQMTTGHLL